MTNETLLDIEQAELIYSMEETTATIYGSQRDINRVSDAAYKAADAYERAYQESGAYEDKKQSLHWRVAAEKWHYKDNSDDSHRRTYYERVREYNHFVRKTANSASSSPNQSNTSSARSPYSGPSQPSSSTPFRPHKTQTQTGTTYENKQATREQTRKEKDHDQSKRRTNSKARRVD